jgi:nucleoside-diphosphate-sugar epimerase
MILVTGASGFLGRHLVSALASRFPGRAVRLFDLQPPTGSLPANAEAMVGSIEDPEAAAAATTGVEVVIHLAAKVQPNSRDQQELRRINVEGARTMHSAAVRSGCTLFLHMSSAGVYGQPRRSAPFRETDATRPEAPYQRTKFEAEQVLLAIEHGATRLNILRPAGIYGAGSHLEIPGYKAIVRQRWAIEQKGGVMVHPTHVSDVVGAIIAILEHPAPHGAVLNVGGERPILLQELQALVAQALGVRRRRIVLPANVASAVATVAGPLLAALGRPKPNLYAFSCGETLNSAVDDTAFRAQYPRVPVRALRDGIQEQVDWARSSGLL